MQENQTGFFPFFTRFLVIFGVNVMIVAVVGVFGGEASMPYSTMFKLGGVGITYETLLQLCIADLLIALLNDLFLSDKIFKNMIFILRMILMMLSIVMVMAIFIIKFKWFPADFVPGWIGFIAAFSICFLASVVVSVIKTKVDNKKYNELLERYKEKQETEHLNETEDE